MNVTNSTNSINPKKIVDASIVSDQQEEPEPEPEIVDGSEDEPAEDE